MAGSGGGAAGDGESHAVAETGERQHADGARGAHAGQGLDARERLAEEFDALGLGAARGHGETQREQAAGVEAGIDRGQPEEAADHEAGADQKHDGEGDFRYDEHAAQAHAAAGVAAAAFLERFINVGP